jgi:hypothetical protein
MDVDALFGLPLDRFVPERTALARALRSEGRRDEAAEVARTGKPSVAAWAVNQLVRTQHEAVSDLFAAGDAVRSAQDNVLAGRGDAHALRVAGDRERAAVEDLLSSARGLLTSEGHGLSATTLERVAETLHAAALQDEARSEVRAGRLEHELRHVGLGVPGVAFAPSASPARDAKAKPRSTQRRNRASRAGPAAETRHEHQREEEAQERAEARRAERERTQALKAARSAETAARRTADRAARALKSAEGRQEQAAQALHEAEESVSRARDQAQLAGDEHRRAVEKVESLDP